MSSISQSTPEQQIPPIPRKDNVAMGRQDYVSVLLRLTGSELYRIRRRPMSKVLSTIAICAIVLGFLFTSIPALFAASSPVSNYLPPPCTASADPTQVCLDHTPTQADLDLAATSKRDNLRSLSSPLYLPGSFTTASQIAQGVGLILIIILAGAIVGGEYGIGTIRVLYTRGPSRTQFLLAKLLALLSCIVLSLVVLIALGIIIGAILHLFTGLPVDFSFFTIGWLLHAIAYFALVALGLLMYALIALCLSTLGRATAAGLAGALVWWGVESILGSLFVLVSTVIKGPFSSFLRAVPDYFIGNNISALLTNQSRYLTQGDPSPIPDLHAFLVLLAYGILFFGSAWLVNRRRDVTN